MCSDRHTPDNTAQRALGKALVELVALEPSGLERTGPERSAQ